MATSGTYAFNLDLGDAIEEASYIAANMQKFDSKEAVVGQSLFCEFDKGLIDEYLGYLSPKNF